MKKDYTRPSVEIIEFKNEDLIMNGGEGGANADGPSATGGIGDVNWG